MEWTRKAEKSEKTVEERKKAETKRVTEKRKFLAQNFQKVGILFILKEPPASPRGESKRERTKKNKLTFKPLLGPTPYRR